MAKYLIQSSHTNELLGLLDGAAEVSYHGSRNGNAYAVADLPDEETLVRLSSTEGVTVVGMQLHSPRVSNGPWYVKSGLPN